MNAQQAENLRILVYRGDGGSHWVVVDETKPVRSGSIGDTLRDAIDKAAGGA
jgi:hypothetical protein